MLIDSHCHLQYDYSPKTAEDLIREARAADIQALVTVGTDLASSEALHQFADSHPDIYFTVGIHPHDSLEFKNTPEAISRLRQASLHPKCRAIGEIGLDYYYEHSPRNVQIESLKAQLELARERRLPVVIHSRDAESDLAPELDAYAKRVHNERGSDAIPGVIHCFTGTQAFGKLCIDLGFYLSFSGILTFKTAEDLRLAALSFPLERLLVETDSPYLAPVPYRGKKCEPAMVKATALKLAELKRLSFDEVAAQTTANSKRVFGI